MTTNKDASSQHAIESWQNLNKIFSEWKAVPELGITIESYICLDVDIKTWTALTGDFSKEHALCEDLVGCVKCYKMQVSVGH